jgi:hypothetical protein
MTGSSSSIWRKSGRALGWGLMVCIAVIGLDSCAAGIVLGASDIAPSGQQRTPFVHPGLLHTQADFDRMTRKVNQSAQPWTADWQRLVGNNHASLNWKPNPQAIVYRGYDGVHRENYPALYNDAAQRTRWRCGGESRATRRTPIRRSRY